MSPTPECKERRNQPERRGEDGTIKSLCDRVKKQQETLEEQGVKQDNHELMLTHVVKLHKEALELHKETHANSVKNSKDIQEMSHKQDVLAQQTSPIIEALSKINDAVSVLAWINSKVKWIIALGITISAYSADVLDRLIDAIAKGH